MLEERNFDAALFQVLVILVLWQGKSPFESSVARRDVNVGFEIGVPENGLESQGPQIQLRAAQGSRLARTTYF